MTYPHDDRDQQPNDNRRPGQEDEGPLLPAGDYAVTAVTAKLGYAGTKNEQIGIRLRIMEGTYKGKTLLYYGSFAGKAEEFTVKAMLALGFTGADMRDLSSMLQGTSAIAVVEHSEYQGKITAKVQWINGADVQMKDEMKPNEVAAFAQRMRGVFARYGQQGASAKSAKDVAGGGRDQRGPDPRGPDPRDQQRGQQRGFADQQQRPASRGYDPNARPSDADPWDRQ